MEWEEPVDAFKLLMQDAMRAVRPLHVHRYLEYPPPVSVEDFLNNIPRRARRLPYYGVLDHGANAPEDVNNTFELMAHAPSRDSP